ncbi:MAG TPA: CHASE3 domain-containing protein, partial [Rhodanobacter sp.]|nr:CHASE3 domain-containing protein [Rhodanobacter sp.]
MKFSGIIRWRVAGLLLAMLIIVGLPYIVTGENAQSTQLASAWVTHSTAVRALAFRIANTVHDSEAATYRVFAGDGDAATQARAARASTNVPDLLQQLRSLTSDNPEQLILIGALETSVNGRLTLMRQALLQLRQGDATGARESLRTAGDLFPVNDQLENLVQNENQLLAVRAKAASDRARSGQLVLAITALAQLLLLAIIVVASEKQIGRRLL